MEIHKEAEVELQEPLQVLTADSACPSSVDFTAGGLKPRYLAGRRVFVQQRVNISINCRRSNESITEPHRNLMSVWKQTRLRCANTHQQSERRAQSSCICHVSFSRNSRTWSCFWFGLFCSYRKKSLPYFFSLDWTLPTARAQAAQESYTTACTRDWKTQKQGDIPTLAADDIVQGALTPLTGQRDNNGQILKGTAGSCWTK